jgi:uncharacterized protein YidB (DUF937 family)
MSLRDVLTGIQNGPRGARQPTSDRSGGMSPLVLALLGLLAYQAFKGRGGEQAAPPPDQTAPVPRGGTTTAAASGGGLGDLLGGLFGGRSASGPAGSGASLNDPLRGGLGGLLGGAAAGSVLSGGLGNLIRDLQNSGHGGRGLVGATRAQSANCARRSRPCAGRRHARCAEPPARYGP